MYTPLLHTHNTLRWVILALGLTVLLQAAQGLGGDRPYAKARRLGVYFTGALHLQLLLGLGLFGISPFMKAVFGDMAAAMADPARRFFVAEHPALMVIATILMTVGGLVAKNAADDAARHRQLLAFTLGTLALILWGIPWQRALFPGM
jgi:hypothetical protein